jgi:2-methylcitrate dehydratase PrpD
LHARPRRQAIVEVGLHDGTALKHRVVAVRGTAANPMDRSEVAAKARDLVVHILGAKRTDAFIDSIWSLSSVKDVTQLRRFWQVDTSPARGQRRPPPSRRSRQSSKATQT